MLNDSSLPPPTGQGPSSLDEVISIAREVVKNRTSADVDGPQPLMDATGGAAGDPPSIGVAVLLANWTGAGAQDSLDYAGAAKDQLEFLLEKVPRTDDGAISHRNEEVQLWCVSHALSCSSFAIRDPGEASLFPDLAGRD